MVIRALRLKIDHAVYPVHDLARKIRIHGTNTANLSAVRNSAYETIECRRPYGMEHDGKNACFLTDMYDVTCEGTF